MIFSNKMFRIWFLWGCAIISILVCGGIEYFSTDPEPMRLRPEMVSMLESRVDGQLAVSRPEDALETYRAFDVLLNQVDPHSYQTELLYNQAVVAYKAGKYGLAIGYFTRLSLTDKSPEIAENIHSLQMVVEHQIFQDNPEQVYVRGVSERYLNWVRLQRWTKCELNTLFIMMWTAVLVTAVLCVLMRRKRKSFMYACAFLVTLVAGFIATGIIEYDAYRYGDDLWGVLVDNSDLTACPGTQESRDLAGFIPGQIVGVSKKTDDLWEIERVDGEHTCVRPEHVYMLSGLYYSE